MSAIDEMRCKDCGSLLGLEDDVRELVLAARETCEHLEKPVSLLSDNGAAKRLRKVLEGFQDVK